MIQKWKPFSHKEVCNNILLNAYIMFKLICCTWKIDLLSLTILHKQLSLKLIDCDSLWFLLRHWKSKGSSVHVLRGVSWCFQKWLYNSWQHRLLIPHQRWYLRHRLKTQILICSSAGCLVPSKLNLGRHLRPDTFEMHVLLIPSLLLLLSWFLFLFWSFGS